MHDREAEILDAAEQLFAEGGLEALTVRALVSRSGASTGSLYHRYRDRGGVLAALALRALNEGLGPMNAAVAGTLDAQLGVEGMVLAWLDWVVARPVQARIVYATFGAPELAPYEEQIQQIKMGLYTPLFGWMTARIAEGALRPLPPWAFDPIVFGPAHELARRWLMGAPLPMGEARALVAEAVWRAVAPDPSASARDQICPRSVG